MSFILLILAVSTLFSGIYFEHKNIKRIWVAVSVVTLALSFILGTITIIPTGYTGIKTRFGQIDKTTLTSGLNMKIPFIEKIDKVNNKQCDVIFKGQIWGEANDKTAVYADNVTVSYKINPERSAYIFANVGKKTDNLIPQALLNSSVKSAMVQLSSDQVTNRGKIEPLAKQSLEKAIVEKYGADTVLIFKVTIDDMDFEESYNKAIADKQIARQNAEKQAIENQKAIDLAKTAQDKANIEAETKKIQAQADADAMIIAAKAEAEAYRIKSNEITDNLLKKWELDARNKHGWVTIQGANAIVTEK